MVNFVSVPFVRDGLGDSYREGVSRHRQFDADGEAQALHVAQGKMIKGHNMYTYGVETKYQLGSLMNLYELAAQGINHAAHSDGLPGQRDTTLGSMDLIFSGIEKHAGGIATPKMAVMERLDNRETPLGRAHR